MKNEGLTGDRTTCLAGAQADAQNGTCKVLGLLHKRGWQSLPTQSTLVPIAELVAMAQDYDGASSWTSVKCRSNRRGKCSKHWNLATSALAAPDLQVSSDPDISADLSSYFPISSELLIDEL